MFGMLRRRSDPKTPTLQTLFVGKRDTPPRPIIGNRRRPNPILHNRRKQRAIICPETVKIRDLRPYLDSSAISIADYDFEAAQFYDAMGLRSGDRVARNLISGDRRWRRLAVANATFAVLVSLMRICRFCPIAAFGGPEFRTRYFICLVKRRTSPVAFRPF